MKTWERAKIPVLVGAVCAVVFFVGNRYTSPFSDATAVVPTAVSILHDGDARLDEYRAVEAIASHYSVQHSNGHLMNYFPWSVAVVALPTVAVADAAHALGIGPGTDPAVRAAGSDLATLQQITSAWITGVAMAGVYVLLRRRLRDWSTGGVLALTAIVAFGTSVWSTAALTIWQHGPSLAATTWALVLLDRVLESPTPRDERWRHDRWRAAGAGALLMAAATFRPTNALLLGTIVVAMIIVRRRAVPALLAGAVAVALPWVFVTAKTYSAYTQPYNSAGRLGLHSKFFEALAANLVSPGRGLVVFTPIILFSIAGVVIMLRRRDRADTLQWVALIVVVLHWIAVSAFPDWWGGHSYGPRFFTDILVLLVLVTLPVLQAARRLDAQKRNVLKVTFVTLGIVGFFVHAEGVLIKSTHCWNSEPVNVDVSPSRRVWSWSDALVTRGIRDVVKDPSAAWDGRCADLR